MTEDLKPRYGTVRARFYTHQAKDGKPVPASGKIIFTPTSRAVGGGAVYSPTPRIGYLVEGILRDAPRGGVEGVRLLAPQEGVEPAQWGYMVTPKRTDEAGRCVPFPGGYITVEAGKDIDLAEQKPNASAPPAPQWSAPNTQGERGEPGPPGPKGDPGAPGVGVPQKLSIAGSELTLSPDGGTVTLPSTDLSSLISRIAALEARPVGGGASERKPVRIYLLDWKRSSGAVVKKDGGDAAARHFMTFDPNTGLGITHLDFTVPQGKVVSGPMFEIPTPGPRPVSLVEVQSSTPGGAGVWIEAKGNQFETDGIRAPGRYILNIIGFFEEK